MSKPIPIWVLCGFLGSGKTTLLRRWQREEAWKDAVWIVHDLSETGIDAELLSEEGASHEAGMLHGRVAALHGDHARGRLAESLREMLDQVAALSPPPPAVFLESTGAARPWPLVKAFKDDARFELRHFVVTLDALNLHRDYDDGRLLHADRRPGDPGLAHAAGVLVEQLAFANVMVLTKTDTLDKRVVEAQVAILQALNPSAAVGLSAHAGLLPGHLDGLPAPRVAVLEKLAGRLGLAGDEATLGGVDCTVFRDPRPFHPRRLYDACRSKMTTGLYRTKGFLWMASRPGQVLLWQQSGSQIALEWTGIWRAEIAANRDGRLLPEEIELLSTRLAGADPVFGDRHNELTLIGLRPAREALEKALVGALCTAEEIAAWQRGEAFDDPWPQSLRRIS